MENNIKYYIFPGIKVKVRYKSTIDIKRDLNKLSECIKEVLNEDVRTVVQVSKGGIKGVGLREAVKIYSHIARNNIRDQFNASVTHKEISEFIGKPRLFSQEHVSKADQFLSIDRNFKLKYNKCLEAFKKVKK